MIYANLQMTWLPNLVWLWIQSYFYLFSFKLFWEFPVKRLQMEILPDFIHFCNNLWVLESNAFSSCVLQGLIHQRQDGLLITQSHLQSIKFQQEDKQE